MSIHKKEGNLMKNLKSTIENVKINGYNFLSTLAIITTGTVLAGRAKHIHPILGLILFLFLLVAYSVRYLAKEELLEKKTLQQLDSKAFDVTHLLMKTIINSDKDAVKKIKYTHFRVDEADKLFNDRLIYLINSKIVFWGNYILLFIIPLLFGAIAFKLDGIDSVIFSIVGLIFHLNFVFFSVRDKSEEDYVGKLAKEKPTSNDAVNFLEVYHKRYVSDKMLEIGFSPETVREAERLMGWF